MTIEILSGRPVLKKENDMATDIIELIAKELFREYSRGFEDATDDYPYGGSTFKGTEEEYLDRAVESGDDLAFIPQATKLLEKINGL